MKTTIKATAKAPVAIKRPLTMAPPRMVKVRTARDRVDLRYAPGKHIIAAYSARGADACLALCKQMGITRREMLLTLARIEYKRTAQ